MLKKCKRCGEVKDASEFYNSSRVKDKLSTYCSDCYREMYAEKTKLIEELKTQCFKCGENRNWVIEFHHIDPESKKFSIGSGGGRSWKSIEAESTKCVCLCSNCHKDFHHIYGQRPKNPREALMEYLNIT